jgi:hypothetical protein
MREIYGLTLSPSSSYLGVYERVGFAKYNDKNARIAIDSISRFADPTRRQTLILVSCLNFETQERTYKTWGHTGTLGFYVWLVSYFELWHAEESKKLSHPHDLRSDVAWRLESYR